MPTIHSDGSTPPVNTKYFDTRSSSGIPARVFLSHHITRFRDGSDEQ